MNFLRTLRAPAIIVGAALGVATIIGCGGGSATKSDGNAPVAEKATGINALKPGDTVNINDGTGNKWTVAVNKVTYQTKGCGDPALTNPSKGNAYVLVDVTYTTIAGKGSYNPLDWSVVDKDGNEYTDPGLTECKPDLGSGDGLVGKRHGIVSIEVRAGLSHGQVVYSEGLGDVTPTWNW